MQTTLFGLPQPVSSMMGGPLPPPVKWSWTQYVHSPSEVGSQEEVEGS